MEKQKFVYESKFNVTLKGIIDINETFSDPFKLVIAMEPRNPSFDDDHTRYSNYIALHVDWEEASISMKMNGVQKDLTELTEIVNNDTNNGLEQGVMATYWLSYDRDNRTIKYGKGYAMVETTLLICNLKNMEECWPMFFGIFNEDRVGVSLLVYRTETDITRAGQKKVQEGKFICIKKDLFYM